MNEEALLHRYRLIVFAALLLCLFGLQVASAQTPANISVVSGNGQIFCSCPLAGGLISGYYPLVVKVTDANNKPVAGATVTWGVVVGINNGFGNLLSDTTVTAADGTTSNTFLPGGAGGGTPTTPPTFFQVNATVNSVTATFSLVQAFNASGGSGQISEDERQLPQADSNTPLQAIAGQQGFTSGGQSGQSFKIGVLSAAGAPVVGANVRIANYQSSPSASCVTGPGADPGSVLTDSTGYATCTPVFSGSGSGNLILVIGGVIDPANPGPTFSNLLTYYLNAPPNIAFQVTTATPSSLAVVSGSGQSANAGQPVTGSLVAVVNAQAGGTLSGQTVNWSVSPAGAATLANTSTVSDANGQVSNSLTLSSGASGSVTVTATLASNSALKATFTVNAIPLITLGGLVKVSGDVQTAIVSTGFANPLIVQVNNANGSPVSGIPVTFTSTGGALLSTTSTTTGSNGQAQVSVTAPATAGAVTVTASAAGFTQTFNLTVSPPGPVFTDNSFRNAADQQVGSLSPCSLATAYATGVAPGVQGIVTGNMFGLGALAASLSGDSVTFGATAAPILNVATINNQQQITFQVPCDALAGTNQVTINVGAGKASTAVNLQPVSPGVFLRGATLTLANGGSAPMAVFVRPDGTFVTQSNSARKGETITAYVTGLGPATPSVGTNAVPLPTAISTANNTVVIGVANAGVPLISAQLSADLVGVYRVSFQVPASAPSGNQVFSVGATFGGKTFYSAGAAIPIQ
jgi:adhesin/invasin